MPMLSGTQANIAIKLFGEDLNKMYSLGQEIKQAIANVDGITDVMVEQQVDAPNCKSFPDVKCWPVMGLLSLIFPMDKCRTRR